MPDDHDIPVSRDDLLFTVEMALRKAEQLWPKRRRPGDRNRLKLAADAVVDHIELCGMSCVRRVPDRRPHHAGPLERRVGSRQERRRRVNGSPAV